MNVHLCRLSLTALVSMVLASLGSGVSAAEPTLAAVNARGQLVCGINGQLPGFSIQDAQGNWRGLEVEFCRAVAAAVLGDAGKVRFVPLTTGNRFEALLSGEIDVLARNTTATLGRTARTGIRDAATLYIDGQVVVVPKRIGTAKLADLAGKQICALRGTPHEQSTLDWFGARNLSIKTVLHDTQTALYDASCKDQCPGLVQDISELASTIIASGRATEYLVLPELLATDPLAALVRAGDDEWLDAVRWTHFAQLHDEEAGVEPGSGKLLGLDDGWAYNVPSQVGNYAEMYDRNVGRNSPLKFSRGTNALWTQGGAMYTLPLRGGQLAPKARGNRLRHLIYINGAGPSVQSS